MNTKQILSAAAVAACLASPALAWTIEPPYLSYTAPFVCHAPDDDAVSTSITIYNPQASAVAFAKWVEITELEGAVTPPAPVELTGELQPNTSDKVNCLFVRSALGLPAHSNVMGDVVLQAGAQDPHNKHSVPALDVSARYLVRVQHHSVSYEVVIIPGQYITF